MHQKVPVRFGKGRLETCQKVTRWPPTSFGCHPSLNHYLPRPSRRHHAYACLAVSKGHLTPAWTGWAEIGQQFSPFLLKTASRKGGAVKITASHPRPAPRWLPRLPCVQAFFPSTP